MRKVAILLTVIMLLSLTLGAASAQEDDPCHAELEVMITTDGVEFVRTPDACFENLPNWPYEPHYVEIDGLRQAYVDAGPADAEETILLLHGQPSWSYLYRYMIPVLADAGHRVIAMDHLGMGRSDKPIDPDYYTYLGHVERLEAFIQELGIEQGSLTLFAQDWGSLIGLYAVGTHPDWFTRVVIGDGFLPVFEEGTTPAPLPENPMLTRTLYYTLFTSIPAQQPPFYDEDGNLIMSLGESAGFDLPGADDASLSSGEIGGGFGIWIDYARNDERFAASQVVEAMTYFDLKPEEEAAYDAPFPSRIAMGGPRAFPGLVNQMPGLTQDAWEGLGEFERPFLTIWAGNDPGNLGQPVVQQTLLDHIPGTAGWDHVRLPEASHFLQDDQGEEIAHRMNDFIMQAPVNDDNAAISDAANKGPRIGFEILEIVSFNELRAWVLQGEMTQAEFDALELPQGWMKNQPREGSVDGGFFARSPNGEADGDFDVQEHFGYNWLHTATVTNPNVMLDDGGLLSGAYVSKYHTVIYAAGSTVPVLVSPEGDAYVRIGRDAGRTTNDFALPVGWQVVAFTPAEELVILLPRPTLVIRTENEDSYQGPVAQLAGLASASAGSALLLTSSPCNTILSLLWNNHSSCRCLTKSVSTKLRQYHYIPGAGHWTDFCPHWFNT